MASRITADSEAPIQEARLRRRTADARPAHRRSCRRGRIRSTTTQQRGSGRLGWPTARPSQLFPASPCSCSLLLRCEPAASSLPLDHRCGDARSRAARETDDARETDAREPDASSVQLDRRCGDVRARAARELMMLRPPLVAVGLEQRLELGVIAKLGRDRESGADDRVSRELGQQHSPSKMPSSVGIACTRQ